jgi:hypothetical protein
MRSVRRSKRRFRGPGFLLKTFGNTLLAVPWLDSTTSRPPILRRSKKRNFSDGDSRLPFSPQTQALTTRREPSDREGLNSTEPEENPSLMLVVWEEESSDLDWFPNGGDDYADNPLGSGGKVDRELSASVNGAEHVTQQFTRLSVAISMPFV